MERKSFAVAARDALARCLRCGLCREVCPAFRARGEERFSPRGRLSLLAEYCEGGDYGRPLGETLSHCLACRACAQRCPSGVAGDVWVLTARAAGVCRGGLPLFKSWAFRLALPRPSLLVALTKTLAAAQRLRLLGVWAKLLSLPAAAVLPRPASRPFRPDGAVYPARAPRRGRATYFPGCGTNYLYPDVGRAVVALLTEEGYDVVVPAGIYCCGVPALAAGDFDLARKLARRNVAALGGADVVVTDCGSCGSALQFYYPELLGIREAASLAGRVRDFTQLLEERRRSSPPTLRIAYHDACHLLRGMNVKTEPRRLLREAGEVLEVEGTGGVTCCGGAGSYGLEHPEAFAVVGGERARAIIAAGATVVAAGCPACVFYLNAALRGRGAAVAAQHTALLLAAARGCRLSE